jgi:hypothetical protein
VRDSTFFVVVVVVDVVVDGVEDDVEDEDVVVVVPWFE